MDALGSGIIQTYSDFTSPQYWSASLSEGTALSRINNYLQPNKYGQGMRDLVFTLRTTSPGDSRTGTRIITMSCLLISYPCNRNCGNYNQA